MPITLTPVHNDVEWRGYDWSIEDKEELARLIAKVALGQARHVSLILKGGGFEELGAPKDAASAAVSLLTVRDGADPWHRDGWMFQVISWIAATLAADQAIIFPPHMIRAHKGFDGLQVDIDPKSGEVSSVVIFEDKATKNPRKVIRDEVWAELKKLDAGDRENVLVASVDTLLATRPELDPDTAVRNVIWKKARAFRVSVTISDSHNSEKGRKALFKGYDEIVPGKVARRRAETLYLTDLRIWLNTLADMAIAEVDAIEAKSV